VMFLQNTQLFFGIHHFQTVFFFFCRIHIAAGGRTMRLSLKGRIAKIFDQIFFGGVGDTAWRGHNSAVIEDVTGGLDVTAHTVFIISQSHSVEVCLKPVVSRAQVVKLDPCFAGHVASWWRISETRDIWFQRIWY